MTTGRTKRIILRVLVDMPKPGDQCRIESTGIELLGRADLYAPVRAEAATQRKIAASMASVKGREAMVAAYLGESAFWGRSIDTPALRSAVLADVADLTAAPMSIERLGQLIDVR